MAELNLKQIVDKLNAEFTGDARKLVFWYDEKGEFAEDIEEIALANATVCQLEQGNQFYTKVWLLIPGADFRKVCDFHVCHLCRPTDQCRASKRMERICVL